jgi:hypothetical protein
MRNRHAHASKSDTGQMQHHAHGDMQLQPRA